MIRADMTQHLETFARMTTVEQGGHLERVHSGVRAGVFASERREAHERSHRAHPHPDQSHTH